MLFGGATPLPYREENPPLIPPYQGRFVAVVPLIRGIPPKGGGGFAVVPLIRGIPPKGGRGFVFEALPLIRGSPRRGRGFAFRGSPPTSLSGRKTAPLRGATP